ncbi:uncharacterized protein LOC113504405 [Trichoplusia ni]|uniref:Uncharacterized protein LOC113504405 n=1 Tax=Trichoplusia ni TaxID=7111 RepID=A0A7E5WP23_TRINI|nr:uncharacterized protein LOC113504405 [Trichoplusia ni]
MARTLFLRIFLLTLIKFASGLQSDDSPRLRTFKTYHFYKTAPCVLYILTKYFSCGTVTTFINPDLGIDPLIERLNSEEYCQSVILKSFQDRSGFILTNVYVITAYEYEDMVSGLLYLKRDKFWNPRAKFIITIKRLKDEEVELVFRNLLKHRIYSVVVIRNMISDATIYTYYPFQNNKCGNIFNEAVILGTCEDRSNITDYFPTNDITLLKNCVIRIVASDDVPNFISPSSNFTVYGKYVSGLDQYLLETIADKEGFKTHYDIFDVEEVEGIVLPNLTSTGLLMYLDHGIADIAAGGFVLMENRYQLFDFIWGFNYASYYLYTPAIGDQKWKQAFKEFGVETWVLIFASFLLVMFVCIILKNLLIDDTFSSLNLWGYFFGNANSGLSINKTFRIIILCWAWFAFFISNLYNTALCSLIAVHVHVKPHMANIDVLKSLSYKPCISDNTRMYFMFAYNQTLPEGEYIHDCTYTDGSLAYSASTKNYYSIEMEYSYKLKEYEYLDIYGKPKLDGSVFTDSQIIVMYLVRGFPFIEKFQDYALRLFESGLTTNHLKFINLRSFNVMQRHPKPFEQINLNDLKVHFWILIVGQILSFICFLFEIWYKYIKQDKVFKKIV